MKAKLKEIVKVKRYKRPQILHCGSCPHCIKWVDEFGKNFYCLVDDEYKDTDTKNCPFKEQNNGNKGTED